MKHNNIFIAKALDKLQRLGIEPTTKVIQALEQLWNEAEGYYRPRNT